jgi:transposase
MNVVERQPGDLDRLRALARRERDAKQRDRYRGVILALEGRMTMEIAAMLGRSRPFVQQWAYAYRDGGIEAIKAKTPPGAKPRLPRERELELQSRLDAGPTAEDDVCEFRGEDVRQILEREFGVKYSLNGVYDLLHRLGYSYLSPRPRHYKADPEAQRSFKESAPLLWIESAVTIPRSKSKSGSKTNCERARRGP